MSLGNNEQGNDKGLEGNICYELDTQE